MRWRPFSALLLAAVVVAAGAGAQEAPQIEHDDAGMRVLLPDGGRLELEFGEQPPPLAGEWLEELRAVAKATVCDPYMERYAGYAPVDPASWATLGLPPLDRDCDGRSDRPWYVARQLDWRSRDNRLGAVEMRDVPAVIIRLRARWPAPSTTTMFAAVDADGEAVAGYIIERHGCTWGEALVGRHGSGTVAYRLLAAQEQPLAVTILESGTPLVDGRVFERPVVFTAALEGGSGSAVVTAVIDGAPYTLGSSYGEEGQHRIEVTAQESGAAATAAADFGIDLSAPVFSGLQPPDGSLLGVASVTLSGLVSADAVQVTVAGVAASLGSPAGAWRPFSSPPLVLTEGPNVLALHAEDGSGRATDQPHHLVADTLPPELTIASPSPGLVTNEVRLLVSGTASDPHLSSVTVNGAPATTGGGTFSLELALAEGLNPILAAAADSLGHRSEASAAVVLDTVAPVLTVLESGTAFSDGLLLGRPVVITVDAQDATAVELAATIDGAPYLLGTPFATPGAHAFVVTAADEAGNTSSAARSFTIDDRPPAVDSIAPAPGTVHDALSLNIGGRVSEDAVSLTLGGVAANLGAAAGGWREWHATGVALEQEGPNLLELRAVDAAGNLTELELGYRRDTLPPQLELSAPTAALVTRFASLAVAGSAVDAHLERVTVNGVEVAVSGDGAFSRTVTLLDGPNTLTVTAVDAVQHETTVVRTVTLDTVPPVLAVTVDGQPLADGLLRNTPVTPVVTAVDATEVTLEIVLNGVPFASGTAVSAEGSYLLAVTATDAAGNAATLERSFSIDLTPPALSGLTPPDGAVVADPSPLLTGACDDAAIVTVDGEPATITAGTFRFAGLALAEGTNQVTVTADDAAGNRRSLALSLVLDTSPPVITITAPADGAVIGAATVQVSGTVQDPQLAEVTVAGRAAALSGSAFQSQATLAQEGPNVLTVVAVDRAGNRSETAVTVDRDTTAPTLVVSEPGPSAVLGDGAVAVRGTATDAHPVTVTIDGRPVATGAEGSFETVLQLPEGRHSLRVEASDEVGNRAAVARELSIDLSAPELRIASPAAGAILAAATIAVTGTVADAAAVERVTVNGLDALLEANGAFSLAELALAEGPSTIIARAWDRAGNTGTRSVEVTVDTTPPRVLATVPTDGATGVPPSARPRILFSEPVDPATLAGSIRLLRDGAPLAIAVAAVGAGAEAEVLPEGGLAADAAHGLEVTTGISDRAGHPLEAALSVGFTTLDAVPPEPPILDPVQSPACFATLEVAGRAEPGARVRAAGDVRPAAATAAADGAFGLALEPTVGEGAVVVQLVAEDAAGNASPPSRLEVELDCSAPRVSASDWNGRTTITVRYSETLDAATVEAGRSVTLAGPLAPLSFTVNVSGPTLSLELVEEPAVDDLPLRLALSSEITDAAGNAALPYTQLFAAPGAATFIAGEIFADGTSLELAGARVVLEEAGGPVSGEPPEVSADGRGRFRMPVAGSPVTVRIEADGYLPAWRRIVPVPGAATVLFDARLSERAAAQRVNGPAQLAAGGVRLTIPGAAVAGDGLDAALSPLGEQGLPALLPLGWRPLAAAHVELGELALDPPAVLELGASAPPGALTARYDPVAHAWVAEAAGSVVDVAGSGFFALLVADPEPTSPGIAVAGALLPSAAPADPGTMSAALVLEPPVILPMETALATVTVAPEAPVPSGYPVEARLDELLHVVDGGVIVAPPTAVDLVLYRRDDGSLAANFGLGASETARRIALDEGVKNIVVRSLPAEVRTQDLVGPAGAELLGADGVGLVVPENALDRVLGVRLGAQPLATLPLALPAGLEAVAAADLELGGAGLALAATLSFPGVGEPDAQYLLLSPAAIDGATRWRLVGLGALEDERLVCGPGQLAGLPAPGVRQGGLYVLARPLGEVWALLAGTVLDLDGEPAAASCLVTATGGLAQLAVGDGVYALAAPAGAVELAAEQLLSRDAGALTAAAEAGVLNDGLDIALEIVAPRVLATSPADGAERVGAAAPVTVDFSEPLDLDPASPWGLEVLVVAGDANQVWGGALELAASGTRLTWTPSPSLPAASRVRVTVDGSLRDRQGNRLAGGDQVFAFGVERYVGNEDIDPAKIRLFVPGRDPAQPERAVVEGEAGAVPADVWMWIEDLDHDAPVTTFQADGLGAFATTLEMFDPARGTGVAVGDRLRLHLLAADDPADELFVVELKPWLTVDGLGAFFNVDGGEYLTVEGVGVSAPWGAFPDGGSLKVALRDHTAVLPRASWPSFAVARAAARFELSVAAARSVQLVIPGEPPDDPDAVFHACSRIEVAGSPHPMLVRTARWDAGRGAYVTSPAEDELPGSAGAALAQAAATGNPDPLLAGIRRSMELVVLEPTLPGGRKSALAAKAGRILLLEGELEGEVKLNAMFLDAAGSVVYANSFYAPADATLVAFDYGGARKEYGDPTGGYAVRDQQDVLTRGSGATVPLRPDDEFLLRVTDPDTGYNHAETGFPAPGDDGWVDIPPEDAPGFGDRRARILGGSPFTIFSFEAAVGRTPLTHLVEVSKARADAPLRCDIPAGSLPAERYLRLLNLRTGGAATGLSGAAPTRLELAARVGDPVILVVEPLLSSGEQELLLRFDRPLEGLVSSSMLELAPLGAARTDALRVEVDGDTLRLAPDPVWEAGARYELRLSRALFAALGSPLEGSEPLALPLKVAEITSDRGVAPDAIVAEAALANNVLLIAARDEGLLVYDVSDPAAPRHLDTVRTAGAMAGVAADGFDSVVTLEGSVGQHVVLRLWSLADLADGGGAGHLAEQPLSPPLTAVGPGDLELEVFAESFRFSAAEPPAGITVEPGAVGTWSTLIVAGSLLRPNHPVVLEDGVTRRILWRGRAPASGPLTIPNDAGLPLAQPLRLRAHADTLVWAHAAAGPVIAATLSYGGGGADGFDLGAVGQNADLLSWVRGAGRNAACRELGPQDAVYLGRLAATPRRDGDNVLLAASRYEGIWGFRQGGSPELGPDWIECVRSGSAGSDLADVAAARVVFEEDGGRTGRDLVAVVGHRRLEVFEVSSRGDLNIFAPGVDLGWNPFRVAIDPIDRLIVVRDNASRLAVFALTRPGATPRQVLDTVLPEEAGLGPLVLDPELGLAITGTAPVQYKPPRLELVADSDGDGLPEQVEYLQPLGAPAPPPTADGRRAPSLAWVRAQIVGVPDSQNSVTVRVEGLGPGGAPLPNRPAPFLPSSTPLTLTRPVGLPLDDPGRSVFVSEQPILLIADERARSEYWRAIDAELRADLTAEVAGSGRYALCRNCDRDLDGDGAAEILWSDAAYPLAPLELAAAGRIRASFDAAGASGWIRQMLEAGLAPAAEAVSLPWLPSPPVGRDPGIEARAASLPEVELATGALTLARTDLSLPAPGMDVVLGRDYSSAGIRWGLFGRGWELAGLQRLRPNPDGTVDLVASTGDRFVFGNGAGHPAADASTLTAWGHPGELKKKADGSWFLLTPDGGYTEFSSDGLPTAIRDRHRLSEGTGSELRLHWHPDGTLAQVEQVNGTGSHVQHPRTLTFSYTDPANPGVVTAVEDSAERSFSYRYDGFGRLLEAGISGIELDAAGQRGEVAEIYVNLPEDPSFATPKQLEGGALIDLVQVEADALTTRTVVDADYDLDLQLHPLIAVAIGELDFDIDFITADRGVVTDGDGVGERVAWDSYGRPTTVTIGDDQTTEIAYLAGSFDPLPDVVTLPTGAEVRNRWQAEEAPDSSRRSWFNLRETRRTRDPSDGLGQVVTLANPTELVTSYDYDSVSNQPTVVTLPPGAGGQQRVWRIERVRGEPAAVTDPEGRTTTFSVSDPVGRRVLATDAAGYSTSYWYDDPTSLGRCNSQGSGELCRIAGPGGAASEDVTDIVFDRYGNPKQVTRPASSAGGVRPVEHQRRNSLGWILQSWVDGFSTRESPVPGDFLSASYGYDRGGRLRHESRATADGTVTIDREPTEAGLPGTDTISGGVVDPIIVRRRHYTPGGRLENLYESPSGRATTFSYDDLGRLESRTVTASPADLVTTWTYNRADDLPTRIDLPGDDDLSLAYDPFGRANWSQDALGRATTSDLDGGGRAIGVEMQFGGNVVHRERASFNRADQLLSRTVTHYLPGGGPRDETTTFSYADPEDARGLLHQVTDAEGRVATYRYDAAGRRAAQELPDGTVIATTYWGSGLVHSTTEDPAGAALPSYSTFLAYNLAGLPETEVSPSGLETTTLYDPQGRVTARLAPGGEDTIWSRSPLGAVTVRSQSGRAPVETRLELGARRLTYEESESGTVFEALFDPAGRVVQQVDGNGVARQLQWNPDGTLAVVTIGSAEAPTATLSYGYDAGNRLSSIGVIAAEVAGVEQWPRAVGYDHDALGNLLRAWDDLGVEVERRVWSTGEVAGESVRVDGRSFENSASYDGTFLPAGMGYPDGSTVVLERGDPAGRLSALVLDGTPVWTQSYGGLRPGAGSSGALATARSYDAEGRPQAVSAALASSERFRLERSYNDAGRVESQRLQAGVGATTRLGHDPAQRARSWRLDRAGVSGVEEVLGWAGPASARAEHVFAGSGADRMMSRTEWLDGEALLTVFGDAGTGYRLPGAGPWSYSYDGFGNREQASSGAETRGYRHDWSNRLLEVLSTPAADEPASSVARFRYDPLGRRIATTEGGLSTYRVPWGDQIIAEYVAGEGGEPRLRKRLYWGEGIDELLVWDWDSDFDGELESRLHPLTDAQGSVQAVATADGVVVESYVYRSDGSFLIFGLDTTAPELVLARLRPAEEAAGRGAQTLEMVFSEAVQRAGGSAELRSGAGEVVSGPPEPTVDPRRWTMEIEPALVAGEAITFLLSGFEDRAGNRLAEVVEVDFTAPAEDEPLAVASLAEPEILAVIDGPDGLALIAGAPVDPESVNSSSLTVTRSGNEVAGTLALVDAATDPAWDGRILLWTPDEPAAYLGARYDVVMNLAVVDVAGRPVDGPSTIDYDHIGGGDIVWSKPSEVPLLGASQVGNDRFLHGRPYLFSLGLYDHRARFYEPGTQTFLEPDPLGPVDSPNLYQAFGWDGLNVTDPWGECQWGDWECWGWVAKDFATSLATDPHAQSTAVSALPGVGDLKDWQEVVTGADLITGERLTWWERGITVGAAVVPVLPGKGLRKLADGVGDAGRNLKARTNAWNEFEKLNRGRFATSTEASRHYGEFRDMLVRHNVDPGRIRVTSGDPDKVAVIGRGMETRVKPVAAEIGAETFPLSSEADKQWKRLLVEHNDHVPDEVARRSLAFAENRDWISKIKGEGYTVLDLDELPGNSPNTFYRMEQEVLYETP